MRSRPKDQDGRVLGNVDLFTGEEQPKRVKVLRFHPPVGLQHAGDHACAPAERWEDVLGRIPLTTIRAVVLGIKCRRKHHSSRGCPDFELCDKQLHELLPLYEEAALEAVVESVVRGAGQGSPRRCRVSGQLVFRFVGNKGVLVDVYRKSGRLRTAYRPITSLPCSSDTAFFRLACRIQRQTRSG